MKPSPIDRRLAAKGHQAQIALIRRTDVVSLAVARVYDRLVDRLLAAAADGHAGLLGRVHSACAQAKADAFHVLEKQFPELIRQQHREHVESALKTIPLKWFRTIVHPKHAARLHRDRLQEDDADPVNFDDELSPARFASISPAEYKRIVEETVFPPLSPAKVDEILVSPGYNKLTWQERFHRYVPADQDAIHNELLTGIADGEDIRGLRKRMETIVAGPSYKAQRIARTEGRRVAEQGGMQAYSEMGEMLEGMRILAVMDEATRPEHAARNGKLYKLQANGEFRDEAGRPLPELPDAPNCRCTSIPVLKTPKEFEDDPRIKAEFETAQGETLQDPSSFDDWFSTADEKSRKLLMGTRRYQLVSDRLPDGQQPQLADFQNPKGGLMTLKELKAEQPAGRAGRVEKVKQLLAEQERLYRETMQRLGVPAIVAPDKGTGSGRAKQLPEPPKSLPSRSEPKRPLRELIHSAENEVRDKPVEHVIAFDSAGKEVLRKSGTKRGIELTPEEQAGLRGAVAVHNHPEEVISSGATIKNIPPSAKDDLGVLLGCGAKEIRAVAQDYRFILKARPDSRYRDVAARLKAIRQQWTRAFNRLKWQRRDSLLQQYGEPLPHHIDVELAEKITEDAHRAWQAIARQQGLIYRRESL